MTSSTVTHILSRPGMWTVKEVAELLHISRNNVYQMVKQGRIPSLTIGTVIRFDSQALADWLEAKTV